MSYGIYYPENMQRMSPVNYETAEKAIARMIAKPGWLQIRSYGEQAAAFMNAITGGIVVIMEISTEGER